MPSYSPAYLQRQLIAADRARDADRIANALERRLVAPWEFTSRSGPATSGPAAILGQAVTWVDAGTKRHLVGFCISTPEPVRARADGSTLSLVHVQIVNSTSSAWVPLHDLDFPNGNPLEPQGDKPQGGGPQGVGPQPQSPPPARLASRRLRARPRD